MEECGFKELKIKSNGHVWRKVPNRSWQAKLKGDIPPGDPPKNGKPTQVGNGEEE